MWHLRLVKLKHPYPDTSTTMKQKTLGGQAKLEF